MMEENYLKENGGARCLLLAEDNDLNAAIARTLLEREGFRVERVRDGRLCLKLLSAREAGYYDAVLMDVEMPNMDGLAASREIRKLPDPGMAGIPIIAMTASSLPADRQECLDAGMDGFAVKPIEIPALLKELERLLGDGADAPRP